MGDPPEGLRCCFDDVEVEAKEQAGYVTCAPPTSAEASWKTSLPDCCRHLTCCVCKTVPALMPTVLLLLLPLLLPRCRLCSGAQIPRGRASGCVLQPLRALPPLAAAVTARRPSRHWRCTRKFWTAPHSSSEPPYWQPSRATAPSRQTGAALVQLRPLQRAPLPS